MEKEKLLKKEQLKQKIFSIAPLFGLIALAFLFFVCGTIQDLNIAYSLKNILNQSVVVAVVATGAIFIYTLGSFDISLGASCCGPTWCDVSPSPGNCGWPIIFNGSHLLVCVPYYF